MTIITGDTVSGCRSALTWQEDKLYIKNTQDTTVLEEYNAAHRAMIDQKAHCAKDGELAGSVPLVLMYKLMKEGIWQDDEALLAWLELPENEAWKMHPRKFA